MAAAKSEAQRRASKKYIANNYKRILLELPNQEYEVLLDAIDTTGSSKNGFIRAAIREKAAEVLKQKKSDSSE